MKKLILCDGSILEYEPKYQTTSECSECGHISLLEEPYEIDEPDRHKGPWERAGEHSTKCLACGALALNAKYIVDQELKRVAPKISEAFERESPFYRLLKK